MFMAKKARQKTIKAKTAKPNALPQPNRFTTHLKRWSIPYLVVLVTLTILAIVLVPPYQQRRQFKQVEKDMATVVASIEKEQGVTASGEASCGRSNEVFGKGPLVCSVSYTIDYGAAVETKENEVYASRDMIASSGLFEKQDTQSRYVPETVGEKAYEQYTNQKTGFTCSFNVVGPSPNTVMFNCAKIALRSYYPYEQ